MRHNGQPVLLASSLNPQELDLTPGQPPSMVCAGCGYWQAIRSPMHVHRPNGRDACSGSGQRVRIDLTPGEWASRLTDGVLDAGQIRRAKGRRSVRPDMFLGHDH